MMHIKRMAIAEMTKKPMGFRAYGSIPHLPNSRLGDGDHYISFGQSDILTARARDKHDRIIVAEKLDGSCCAVWKSPEGEVVALGRAGFPASSSPYEHVANFAEWVAENRAKFDRLERGMRLVGEWCSMAHGTIYERMNVPFIVFDAIVGQQRVSIDDAYALASQCELPTAHILSDGPPASIQSVISTLGSHGFHGAVDGPEGAVWRVERRGKFEFAAKFVRHDKIDGKYFPQISGEDAIWFWRPA